MRCSEITDSKAKTETKLRNSAKISDLVIINITLKHEEKKSSQSYLLKNMLLAFYI